ncbi:hypothetical protein ccbrp13_21440 [Ktedonobacteria bacterium brp13]|nr:hypothetical protein ccbrp13_21440 [Ktedonobacteria bacterium brp13]
MTLLEELVPSVLPIGPQHTVTIIVVTHQRADYYKDAAEELDTPPLYCDDTEQREIVPLTLSWFFTGEDGNFRLVSEAYRIRFAYLFDQFIHVYISISDSITAVAAAALFAD